jgi:hypothetical protein
MLLFSSQFQALTILSKWFNVANEEKVSMDGHLEDSLDGGQS